MLRCFLLLSLRTNVFPKILQRGIVIDGTSSVATVDTFINGHLLQRSKDRFF